MSLVNFEHWADQCPNLDYDNAYRAVTCQQHKNFINPSRVSPLDVNILYTSNDHKRAILQCDNVTAVCLSPLLSRDSCILEPSLHALRNKYLTGHYHHQEWEHFAGFACMVFGHKVMVAQIRDGVLSFGTMGSKADRDSVSPIKQPRNPGILSDQPETKWMASTRIIKANTGFKSLLDTNDTIPVYDSCDYLFNFKNDLDCIAETLLLWHGEIPPNSFVVVTYTMTQYEKDKVFYLSTNIIFAILFATEYADNFSDVKEEEYA
ncbi:hypothetical protein CVT25_011083 [Psilocybe cyanescens]|uniref:Uncharacterized protein n=1 Tax=Psilocybe cyanescens TaxID=93625 RepID=A0A409X4X1_PSICY|nr:hypothetical protein CVT25_011083 [Psilocybe cyanescens]